MNECLPFWLFLPLFLLGMAAVLYQRRRAFMVWVGLKEEARDV